jgi:hypothetical protein
MITDLVDTIAMQQAAAGSNNPVGTPGGASVGSSSSAAVNLGIQNKLGANTSGHGPSTGPIPGLVSYSWHGMPLTTAKGTKKNFLGLLNALAAQGYKVSSLGSYANRNARGSNRLSEHAYGRAIDINPSQNPMTSNANFRTNMPSNIARLAQLHGLIWGGTWKSKKDPMHFSTTGY